MTEYELLDLINSTIEGMGTSFTIYLSMVSGYLVVAYLAGNKLTIPQTAIVGVLFIFSAGLQVWSIYAYQAAVREYLDQKKAFSPLTPYQTGLLQDNGGTIFALLMTCGIIASLYFMWSVRHPKTQ